MENNGDEAREPRSDDDTRPAKDHHHAASASADDASTTPKKRRKVNHACVYCRRSHMTCDLDRPCLRCIKRNIGHLCHDEPRDPDSKKQKGPVMDDPDTQNDRIRTSLDQSTVNMGPPTFDGQLPKAAYDASALGGRNSLQLVPPSPIQGGGLGSNMNQLTGEFNLLNDFLHSSLLDDGAPLPDDQAMLRNSQQADMLSALPGDNNNTTGILAPTAVQGSAAASGFPANEQGSSISRPASVVPLDKTREYYLQAADPAGNDTAEERMARVLRAKYEAGLLKPFNYVKGYQRLSTYLDGHVGTASKQKILRQLDRFRPKFREKMHALTDMDLVIVEMWFEKTLMEYDRVFASMAVPACCWRRTGEIFRGNKEMAELIHVPVERLREGKIALHEILTEESVVRYWEEFGTIAFDSAHDTLLTACSLKNPDDRSNDPIVNCCFSFMIRRDDHKVPTLIVGNFLPHDPHPR